jgi:hypothetical protein
VAHDLNAERKAHLREAIAQHLQGHPLAGDTPEGIIASWLPVRGYEDASIHISAVLDAMVASGELAPRALPDGRTLYVRCPARLGLASDLPVK